MTRYERYIAGETDLVQTDFVRSLFAAYQDADEIDKEILAQGFPEYFRDETPSLNQLPRNPQQS